MKEQLGKLTAPLLAVALIGISSAYAADKLEEPIKNPPKQVNGRTVLSLDGEWQIEAGEAETKPAAFKSTIPVPGVVKLAKPGWGKPLSLLGPGHEDVLALGKDGKGEPLPEEEAKKRREAYADSRKKAGFSAYWYRRTVAIAGEVPETALLRVGKARWGVKAWVNGTEVGEHNRFRTAGVFDVRSVLKGGGQENEILLRIGGRSHEAGGEVPNGNPWGGVMPGIYDSVSLVLCGSPRIVRTQSVPQLADGSVRFVGLLRNTSDQPRTSSVSITVREDGSGQALAASALQEITLEPGAEKEFDHTIKLPNAKLWSPESPHLYAFTVEAKEAGTGSVTDRLDDRFGMREFRIDPKTGAATLNGRHVFLRGAGVLNVTDVMEHPGLGAQPWEEAWIRRALRNIKTVLNGNAARSAFDFMPELWYRIADEEGVMIQDEATSGIKPEQKAGVIRMFSEWIHERANHPCVVIWDAANEIFHKPSVKTYHEVIAEVRRLDLSNRPWDCSWHPTGIPGDVTGEPHPYAGWSKGYSMHVLAERGEARQGDDPWGIFREHRPVGPGYIINEFCGVFLRSGGRVSSAFPGMFLTRMKPEAAAEDRLVVRARFYAAETECWRRHPGCIGVMPNPYLHGSDRHYTDDVTLPRIERHFARFVGDALAPLGVMLDYFPAPGETKVGASATISVSVVNDGQNDWRGSVNLTVLKAGRNLFDTGAGYPPAVMMAPPETGQGISEATAAHWSAEVAVPVGKPANVTFDVVWPSEPGFYLLMAEATGADGKPVRSWRDLQIKPESRSSK